MVFKKLEKAKIFLSPQNFHHRLIRRLKRDYLGRYYIQTSYNLQNTIYVAGTHRGGTTWLGEMIADYFSYRLMNEPFFGRFPISRLNQKFFLPPEYDNINIEKILGQIFSGNCQQKRLDHQNFVLLPKGQVVKTVNSLLLLKWIRNHFNFPIIYLLRHPCAVVNSRLYLLKKKKTFLSELDHIRNQPRILNLLSEEQLKSVQNSQKPVANLAHIWALEHFVVHHYMRHEDYIITTYEGLVVNLQREMQKIIRNITPGIPYNPTKIKNLVSFSSAITTAIMSVEKKLQKWQDRLTSDQIATILKIVEIFGLDTIYDEQLLPKKYI